MSLSLDVAIMKKRVSLLVLLALMAASQVRAQLQFMSCTITAQKSPGRPPEPFRVSSINVLGQNFCTRSSNDWVDDVATISCSLPKAQTIYMSYTFGGHAERCGGKIPTVMISSTVDRFCTCKLDVGCQNEMSAVVFRTKRSFWKCKTIDTYCLKLKVECSGVDFDCPVQTYNLGGTPDEWVEGKDGKCVRAFAPKGPSPNPLPPPVTPVPRSDFCGESGDRGRMRMLRPDCDHVA